jgi:two-component system sensor histidine kinase PilS (NtrC family)
MEFLPSSSLTNPNRLRRLGFYVLFGRLGFLFFLVIVLQLLISFGAGYPSWLPLIPVGWIAVCLVLFALNVVWGGHRAFHLATSLLDVLFVAALIFFTGGVESDLIFLLFAVVLLSAFVLGDWSSLVVASTATVLIAAKTFLSLLDPGTLSNLRRTFAMLAAQGLALHFVAYLASRLAIGLSRQRVFNDLVLENISDAILVVGLDGRVSFQNPAAKSLLCLTNEIEGRPLEDALGSPGLIALREIVSSAGEEYTEIEIEPAPGIIVPVDVKVSAVPFPSSAASLKVVLIRDLTSARKLEEAQSRSRRLQEFSVISAGVAHEIRNPLAAIKGAAGELSRDILDPELQKMCAIVRTEADRLNNILSDFLKFTRLRTPRLEDACLRKIALDVRNTILAESPDTDYTVSIPEDICCRVDSEQFKQVLLNLSLNSVQACSEKAVIRVSAEHQNLSAFLQKHKTLVRDFRSINREGIVIVHEDEGPGIPEADRANLFLPFFTTKEKGSGLGLAMAQRVLDAHNGLIAAEHNRKKGVAFRIWLPRKQFAEG